MACLEDASEEERKKILQGLIKIGLKCVKKQAEIRRIKINADMLQL